MAKSARKLPRESMPLARPEGSRGPSLREANSETANEGMLSPAQSLQQVLMQRIEAEGLVARWPALFRISIILACAAACWAAILTPLSLL